MSIAATPGWEAASAILIAGAVVLWLRWKRNRLSAVTTVTASLREESNVGKTSKRVSLELRVHRVDGKLTLTIPLDSGGREFITCCRGISEVVGDDLKVTIPDWLANKVGVEDRSLVQVDNNDGKFNFTPIEAPPEYTRRN